MTITLVQQMLKTIQEKPEVVALIGRLVPQTVVSTGGQGSGLDSAAAIFGALLNNGGGADPGLDRAIYKEVNHGKWPSFRGAGFARGPLGSRPGMTQGCPGKVGATLSPRNGLSRTRFSLLSPRRPGGEGRVRGADGRICGAAHLTLPGRCRAWAPSLSSP